MNKALSIILIIVLALALFTGAIAVPILARPFYYMEIERLDIAAQSGFDEETIKTAYNEMMDFCIGASDSFSTGALKYSQSGKEHFEDCKVLFLLDLRIFAICIALLAALLVLIKIGAFQTIRFNGKKPCFFAGVSLLSAIALVFGLCAINFDRAFTIFHQLFFPGKSNWYFDPRLDQIIDILPEEYFMDCGILIALIIALGCALFIYFGKPSQPKSRRS